MSRDYLINCLYLQKKINLKKPLSRGSRFKIYFRLERRRNRGSHQNFHRISFSKDRTSIISDQQVKHEFITITYLSKIKQFKPKHGCQKWIRMSTYSYPKVRVETTKSTHFESFLSFLFREFFIKRDTLGNNNDNGKWEFEQQENGVKIGQNGGIKMKTKWAK